MRATTRVIVYVRPGFGAQRTQRELKTEVGQLADHNVVGVTTVAAEAQLALSTDYADKVAGRPNHLLDLPHLLPIPRSGRGALGVIVAAPAGLAAWAAARVRRPTWVAAAGVTLAGLVAMAAVAFRPTAAPDHEVTLPPPARPSATASAAETPSAAPSVPPSTVTPPPQAPHDEQRPAPDAAPSPARPDASGPAPAPPVRPPNPSPDPPVSPPDPVDPPTDADPPPAGQDCQLRLDLPLVDIQLCLLQPNVQK